MLEEKVTISLEEFIKFLLRKWKIVLTIIVINILLFVGGAKLFGNEINVPHSEEYLRYEKELEWHKSYLEESILMNLDPTCIYNRTLFVRNISDIDLLKDYVVSTSIWNELQTERSTTYISELLTWEVATDTKSVIIKLRHATSEECLEWIEYLRNKIMQFDAEVEVIVGEEQITTDEKLQEEHLRWYSRIDYVSSLLLNAQAGYTLKVHPVAAMLTGVLSGTIVAAFIVLVNYIIKRK